MLDMIGDRLKQLRLENNLDQPSFGAIAGTSKQYVSRLESGLNKKPNAEFLQAWASHFGVRLEWLISGKGPKEASPVGANSSPPSSQSERLDAARLAAAIQLSRRALENMGVDDFNAEADAEIVAQAYAYLGARGTGEVTDGNVIDFTRAVRQGERREDDRAPGTGAPGRAAGGAR